MLNFDYRLLPIDAFFSIIHTSASLRFSALAIMWFLSLTGMEPANEITEEMIRLKAYELWEERGKPEGTAEQDWFNAQDLLKPSKQNDTAGNQLPPIGLRQLTSG
jgi:hypothetical protein